MLCARLLHVTALVLPWWISTFFIVWLFVFDAMALVCAMLYLRLERLAVTLWEGRGGRKLYR